MNKAAEKKKRVENKHTSIVVVLGVVLFLGSVVLVLALMGVFDSEKNTEDEISRYVLTSSVVEDNDDESINADIDLSVFENPVTNEGGYAEQSEVQISSGVVIQENYSIDNKTTKPATTKSVAVEYYEQLSPKGNNMLSDNRENEFIKLISETYGVNSDVLVAVYAVPDNGDNFVLQFNGKKDKDGNYIKSPDTLQKVYQIDKTKNVKIATGKATGNVGVSYGEGLLCFNMMKTIVMEQYPDYFTGLKGK